MSITKSESWRQLAAHTDEIRQTHLRDLMGDEPRVRALVAEHDGVLLDWSRQRVTPGTMQLLFALAREARVPEKIAAMFRGDHINTTEDRAVMHVALRAAAGESMQVDGRDVVPLVDEVRGRIAHFAERVRSGEWRGATGEKITDVVSIGIGGSYLGPEFVFEALRTEPACVKAAEGRRLRFLANVDPIDVARALEGLRPETTMVVVVSKTFTTAETMLNARTLRRWIVAALGEAAVAKHVVAVSTNLAEVASFGIDPANAFGFWDWVGGRYSVTSAVGLAPLALQYGWAPMERFLAGARSIDRHFASAQLEYNLPVILGLIGVWNCSFLGHATRALLPYCQALLKLAPHIQQVDMESNGKRVATTGEPLGFDAGEVDFGEPGTNGQHSFYQLIHQGRVVPCDFVGFIESQQPMHAEGEPVSNHDELMANFFAQADALAYGKTADDVRAEGVPEALVPHKVFDGNRPSSSLLLPRCDAYAVGQLLALYEHRTAVQGFVWGLNSFDQWGVELGKVLAKRVRSELAARRADGHAPSGLNSSTTALLARYLAKR